MQFALPEPDAIELPSVEDVHWLHDNVSLFEGGTPGHLDPRKIESALARPLNVLAYHHPSPDILLLAAYLWHGVSQAHAYVDANKRTAVLAMMAFLATNGVGYDAAEDEVGLLVTKWYEDDTFEVPVLEWHLRSRCYWLVE